MGLRMKIYNIFGVHWKTQLLGRVQVKQIYRGDCLKKKGGGGVGHSQTNKQINCDYNSLLRPTIKYSLQPLKLVCGVSG